MRKMQNLIVLWMCSFFLGPAWAQTPSEVFEGFDRQSPAEIERSAQAIRQEFGDAILPEAMSESEKAEVLSRYQHLDPEREVPTDLLETAIVYFDKNKAKFPNQSYFSVVNFKPRSDKFRFFVINLASGHVEKYRTSHGWGSDQDQDGFAERFTNIVDSGSSSIGFVRTAEVYSGKFQRSIRLDGLSSTNSRIRRRSIVVHGWDGVHEAPVLQALSWGCPALDWSIKDRVIDQIKEGSLMLMAVAK
jgi:hypothetical protein